LKFGLIYILLSSYFYIAFAQKEIKGRVLDSETLKPVPTVTVTMYPVGSQSILTYTMTDEDGTFILKSNDMPDSVTVSVRAMTIESQSKSIKSDIGFVEFVVKEKAIELKEVIVDAPKIRQTGDTLNYYVSSFLDETDRSIGDVLKKLPGIQVLSTGQILYQNKEISKFYVEGLDLLQGKYGIATNNIDAKQVATVQVLENLLYDVQYNGILSHTASIEYPNNSHSLGVNFSLGKSIDAINSEVKFFANYNRNNSIVLNQGIISDFISNSFTISPSINTELGHYFIINYNASYSNSRSEIRKNKMPKIHYFTQALTTSFIPVKNIIVLPKIRPLVNKLNKNG